VFINVHPEATGAVLQKDCALWFLVFTGPNGARWDMQLVTPNELGDALHHGYSDEDVVSYIGGQLSAAGYLVHLRPRGTDKAAWSLSFLG
jgi:hypothetical protein